MLKYWSQEERFGLTVAFVFHAILLLILLLIRLDKPEENRSAFIEVDFGQFQFGSPAEFAKEQNKQVQTSKVTSKNKSNEKPIENKPVNEQNTSKSVDKAKPVSAPTQEQNVESEDVVKTPDTEKISPELTTKQQKREEAVAPDVKKAEVEKEGAEKTGDIEGFGIAIIEANYFGLPAIGAKDCGIEDAIDDTKSGRLIAFDAIDEFKLAIKDILANYDTYKKHAKEWALQHSWDLIIKWYIKELEE